MNPALQGQAEKQEPLKEAKGRAGGRESQESEVVWKPGRESPRQELKPTKRSRK